MVGYVLVVDHPAAPSGVFGVDTQDWDAGRAGFEGHERLQLSKKLNEALATDVK